MSDDKEYHWEPPPPTPLRDLLGEFKADRGPIRFYPPPTEETFSGSESRPLPPTWGPATAPFETFPETVAKFQGAMCAPADPLYSLVDTQPWKRNDRGFGSATFTASDRLARAEVLARSARRTWADLPRRLRVSWRVLKGTPIRTDPQDDYDFWDDDYEGDDDEA